MILKTKSGPYGPIRALWAHKGPMGPYGPQPGPRGPQPGLGPNPQGINKFDFGWIFDYHMWTLCENRHGHGLKVSPY